MKKRELIKIYTEAAKDITEARDAFSCTAVNIRSKHPARNFWSEETNLYRRIMLPRNDSTFPLAGEPIGERKNIRVLLLLIMAEWVKTDYVES